ncbi:MAG: TRAP transporter permease [Tissierellia bacterium]|nr:TRAP transporter permease [Tissierellia bacterium]
MDVIFLGVYTVFFSALYMQLLMTPAAIALAIVSSVLLYSGNRPTYKHKMDLFDYVYVILSIVVWGYVFTQYKAISLKGADYTNIDLILGGFAIMLTLEVTRRVVGPELPIVAMVFVAYAFLGPKFSGVLGHKGYSVGRIVSQMFLTTEGIMGIPLGVSATFVFMFILFGSFLDKTGVGKFFIDIAYALTGHLKSGPAMTAVIASGFMGSISGSSVANTVTTGAFTIPLMKKSGYEPHFAGAVEAAASTGGQIMPPVMGAAAFIMAEFTGIAYKNIIIAALIPAVLYYFAVAVMVHLEASKLGLKGIPRSELPKVGPIMKKQGYLLLPLVIIVVLLIKGLTPTISAYYGIVASSIMALTASMIKGQDPYDKGKVIPLAISILLLVQDFIPKMDAEITRTLIAAVIAVVGAALITVVSGMINKKRVYVPEDDIPFSYKEILGAFEAGAKGAVGVACACACAGMIVCVVTLTGLGLRIAGIIVSAAGGNLILTLFFTMIASIILGMGLPTTAKYIVLATMAVPALLQLDVNMMSAHLFILYFGVVADITPPVALAAYAGAGIAGANSMKTGFQAVKIALAAFIVPYLFAIDPSLIMVQSVEGSVVNFLPFYSALPVIVSALIGIVCLASAVEGFFITHTKIYERIPLAAGALFLLKPGLITDAIGLGIIVVVFILQKARVKKLEPEKVRVDKDK